MNSTIRLLGIVGLLIAAGPTPALAQQQPASPGAASPAAGDEHSQLTSEARTLLEQITTDVAEINDLAAQRDAAEGEEHLLLARRVLSRGLEALDRLDDLVANVLEQEKEGLNATEFRKGAEDLVAMLAPNFRQRIEFLQGELAEFARRRDAANGDELIELETELADDTRQLNVILDAALNNIRHMEVLEIDARQEEAYLGEILSERAETEAARLELALEEIARLKKRLADDPENADFKAGLQASEMKRERSADALDTTARMMNRIGLDTADYQTLLIEATGQVSTRILDSKVAFGLFQQWLSRLRAWAIDSGPGLLFKVFLFLLIVFVPSCYRTCSSPRPGTWC
jgi:small conductance mechanosensitive channel